MWIKRKPLKDGQNAENHKGAFEETIGQMNDKGISLAGAVHEYTDPATGKDYLYFPIREI